MAYPTQTSTLGLPVQHEDRAALAGALGTFKSFTYLYDFGDGWEHRLTVEKILPPDPGLTSPICLGGANAGPLVWCPRNNW